MNYGRLVFQHILIHSTLGIFQHNHTNTNTLRNKTLLNSYRLISYIHSWVVTASSYVNQPTN